VGTPALNSVAGQNGFYIGSTGIVGTKDGAATFTLDNAGNATFKGTLDVGASAVISGTTMTGAGAVINPTGTFALGNTTANVTFNGTTLAINGPLIGTGNILANAVSGIAVYTDSASKTSVAAVGTAVNYFTIATLAFESFGGSVIIDAQAVCEIHTLTGGTSTTQTFEVILFADTVAVSSSGRKDLIGDQYVLPDSSNLGYFQGFLLPVYSFTPTAGVHNYYIKIGYSKTGGAGTTYRVAATNVSIKAVEYKR
jgi:hypothetical protein